MARHNADLRDDTGILRIAAEYFGIATQRADSLLDAGAARVNQTDDRHAVANGQIHHPTDFLGVHFAQRAAIDRKILRVDVNGTSANLVIAGDNAITQVTFCRKIHLIALMGNIRLQFVKRAGVKKHLNALAGRVFAPGMLTINAFLSAAFKSLRAHVTQF